MNIRIPHLFLIVTHLDGTSLPTQESNLQTVESTDNKRALVHYWKDQGK